MKSVIEELSQFKSNPEEVFHRKSKDEVKNTKNFCKVVGFEDGQVQSCHIQNKSTTKGNEVKCGIAEGIISKSKSDKSEVKIVSQTNDDVEMSNNGKSQVTSKQEIQSCKGCRRKLEIRSLSQELDRVKLFEHVYASGLPNY